MHFGNIPPAFVGGATPLPGSKYRLDHVLYAYEQMIDWLTVKFGGHSSLVLDIGATELKGNNQSWPHPAKDRVLRDLRGWAKSFDSVGSAVTHRIGSMTAVAYPLGKAWVTYDPAAHRMTLKGGVGGNLGNVDPWPCVELHGHTAKGELVGMSEHLAVRVRTAVTDDLKKFGLTYSTVSLSRSASDIGITALVTFPHETYGDGHDWIRVRCLSPDGQELRPVHGKN